MVSCQRRADEVAWLDGVNEREGCWMASEEASGQSLILRTDGGSRGNPGHAAAGIVIERADGSVLAQGKRYLGVMTNNQAEYHALLLGLTAIQRYSPSSVRVLMDSELIVRQMRGEYRVRDEGLRELYEQAAALVRTLPSVSFAHIPRAQNARADALVNQALDERERTERAERR
jgi:ribonuclease HI